MSGKEISMTPVATLEEILDKFQDGTLDVTDDKIGCLKDKEIMLYGAGNIGKRLFNNFKDNKIQVTCFIDRNRNLDFSKYEVPIYHPECQELAEKRETGYVILSALFSLSQCSEIKENLIELGFKHVFALHEVNLSIINNGAFYENLFDGSYNKIDIQGKDRPKIIEAYSLLETEQDQELYLDFLKAHLTMDFTRFKDPGELTMQYLAHDISVLKNYGNFVDCGGYDGDTLRNFVANGVEMQHIAVFEPQNELCQKISKYLNQNHDKFDSAVLFPCGVHSKMSKLKFSVSSDAPSAAKIDVQGTDIIQCVAIDDVLQGFKPTFIKMDIEGAEVEALKGAKRTIAEYRPQLAICVYHRLSDLWEVPLYIKSCYEGYKFYLRNYNYMGLETVLYAFPE